MIKEGNSLLIVGRTNLRSSLTTASIFLVLVFALMQIHIKRLRRQQATSKSTKIIRRIANWRENVKIG